MESKNGRQENERLRKEEVLAKWVSLHVLRSDRDSIWFPYELRKAFML